MSETGRVLLALSGGVDSTVAAHLLRQQGYEVSAAVICFSAAHQPAVEAAQRSAAELGIPLEVLHREADFATHVIEPFCHTYAQGRTPNPCVVCNPLVKFAALAALADAQGIANIASGHYARVVQQSGVYYPAVAASSERDQSYMLYRMPQAILRRLLLPLGQRSKPEIRALAKSFGFASADAPDSQEICFIPDGDHAAYVAGRGVQGRAGHFIGPGGEDLGPHQGVVHYTVGQRKGLGLALGKPVFVRHILEDGNIRLGWAEEVFSTEVLLHHTVTTAEGPLPQGAGYTAKIRSAAKPARCSTQQTEEGLLVRFEEPQWAPAPGQHCVLYQNELVVGGGEIAQAIP